MKKVLSTKSEVRAFSLVELLVVIVIVVLLASLSLPAINSVISGSGLARGGQMVGDQMLFARQEAISRNCEMQVRFCRTQDGWDAIQIWRVEQTADGVVAKPAGRLTRLPQGIVITENAVLSPLLTADTGVTGTMDLPNQGSVPYKGFRFTAGGSTGAAVDGANNFLTLCHRTSSQSSPANYYTIQLDPLSGKIAVFRP